MTHLYSCRHDGDQYRITKLDADYNPITSYLCSPTECQCQGFERSGNCRHLKMLPGFISGDQVSMLLYDYDRERWVTPPFSDPDMIRSPFDQKSLGDALRAANIPGVTVVDISDPHTLHNTIAEAVGEPTLPEPLLHRFIRRF